MNVTHPSPPIISLDDDLIGQSAIGRRYGVSPASVSRHMTQGVLIAGQRLKLPSIRIAGRRYTTEAALQWWFTTQQQLDQFTLELEKTAEVAGDAAAETDALQQAILDQMADEEGL